MEVGIITHRKSGRVCKVVSMPAVHVPYPRMLQLFLQSEGLNPERWEEYNMNAAPVVLWESVVSRVQPL